jgi:hypothetical protein
MKRLLLALSLIIGVPRAGAEERAECGTLESDLFYFPRGSLGEKRGDHDLDQSQRVRYSKHLRAMGEPSLSCRPPALETYRLIWLRSFHAPVAVRLEFEKATATLTAVKLNGKGGYQPGVVTKKNFLPLGEKETAQLRAALKKADFWKMQVRRDDAGLDGAQWILEGRKGTEYRVVERWSPKTGPYRELCLSLLKLSGLVSGDEKAKGDPIY